MKQEYQVQNAYRDKFMKPQERKKFLRWIEENEIFLEGVSTHKKALLKWFNQIPIEIYSEICECMEDVVGRCDEIEYNVYQVCAYVINHFLDRYYRSLLIYQELFKAGLLPKREQLRVMDIGTGPGIMLYAYLDFIRFLEKYQNKQIYQMNNEIDYVEQSEGFRMFMHKYSEILMMESDYKGIMLPFHNGTYYDATELNFSGKRLGSQPWGPGSGLEIFVRKSFDIIIYSNFLTNKRVVNLFKEQLQKGTFWMHNKGILIIIGGNPKSPKYKPVYDMIDEVIKKKNYATKYYEGGCIKVISHKKMSYSKQSKFCRELIDFHNQVIKKLIEGSDKKISDKYMNELKKEKSGQGEERWWLTVYKRKSKWKY